MFNLKISEQIPNSLFARSLLASFLLHCTLWGGFYLKNLFHGNVAPLTIEVDLTKPFRIGGNPLLKPGGGTSLKVPEKLGTPTQSKTITETKPIPPKDWVLPGPETKELEKPVPESAPAASKVSNEESVGTGEGYPGTGGGWGGGDGEGGGSPLTRFPKLLNRSEIERLLRKLYPEIEREAGREGSVIVDLHVNIDGKVSSVEIANSAGANFDHTAQTVAKKMRFSPAMIQKTPVAVKLRQTITFKLED